MSKNKIDVVDVMSGEGFKVRIFDLDTGLTEYEHIKVVRLISKEYNLLIMQDYLPIIGEIEGSIDIKGDDIDIKFPKIRAFYMNSNNVFNLMIKEVE
jgi:hypothetical protein